MPGSKSRDPLKPWCVGEACDVYWNETYEKTFLKSGNPKDAAKIEATLKSMYAEGGAENVPGGTERLNTNEGRYSVEGKKVRVWAFKSFQLRVYGVEGSVNGKRAFFATEVDPAKKKPKADPGALQRAAIRSVELNSKIKGGKI